MLIAREAPTAIRAIDPEWNRRAAARAKASQIA